MHPAPRGDAGQICCAYYLEIFFHGFFLVWLALLIDARCFGAPIVLLAHYKEDAPIRCILPFDTGMAY
jgi:hypothetical protein